MKKLIKRNIESVLSSSPVDETDISVKNIITQLNQHRFIIVSGSTVLNSASYIHTTIIKSNIKENCFYFDASLDYNHKVQNHKILFQLIDDFFSHNTSKTKLIVLKGVEKLDGIKKLISKIYSSKKYYLIIISNSIKIPNIPEVELLYHEDTLYDEDKLFYGNYQIINEIESIDSKKQILHYMYYETITNAILNNFSIKNLESYLQVMVRLSKLQEPVSLRKLHAKLLERGVDISLITMIDYVEYSLQAKLIHRVYPYDIKLQKHIKAKAKYYFYDTGIRNTINCFSTNIQILKENYILSHLHSLGYSISSGINGRFSWTLVIHKDSIKNPENILFHIHVSKQNTKKEIKKEINKLNKIGDNKKKYLIVGDISELGLKKLEYEDVVILELKGFTETIRS